MIVVCVKKVYQATLLTVIKIVMVIVMERQLLMIVVSVQKVILGWLQMLIKTVTVIVLVRPL